MSYKKRLVISCLLALMLLPAFIFSSAAASNKGTCKVSFGTVKNGSFVNNYTGWDRSVASGRTIKLPALKDKDGKRAFWQVIGSSEVRNLRSGERCVITENTRCALYWNKIYRISFYNTTGTRECTRLRLSLAKGETYALPVLKDTATHYFSGWTLKENAGSTLLKPNRAFRVKMNLSFYAVWKEKPKYTVRFFNRDNGKEYINRRITKYAGETYTLPAVSVGSDKTFLGWSESVLVSSTNLCAGKTCTMDGSRDLYTVSVKKTGHYAAFMLSSGQVCRVCAVDGRTVRFPSIAYHDGRTCIGWSLKKGTDRAPQYLENDIVPARTATYYAVEVDSKTADTSSSGVKETSKYTYAYIVGDSRIWLGSYYMGGEFKKTRLICKSGSGYDWLSAAGYAKLLQSIRNDNKKSTGRKAVVFCHGINDLGNISRYITFYRSKAKELRKLGCDLYVLSINPFNQSQSAYWQQTYGYSRRYVEFRTQPQLQYFNKRLRSDLAGIYGYIDTNTYLRKTGWDTCSIYNHIADGLHYSKAVTRKVFNGITAGLDAAKK